MTPALATAQLPVQCWWLTNRGAAYHYTRQAHPLTANTTSHQAKPESNPGQPTCDILFYSGHRLASKEALWFPASFLPPYFPLKCPASPFTVGHLDVWLQCIRFSAVGLSELWLAKETRISEPLIRRSYHASNCHLKGPQKLFPTRRPNNPRVPFNRPKLNLLRVLQSCG
jgi:hypothetical protein